MKKHGGWGGPTSLDGAKKHPNQRRASIFFSTTYAVPILQILYFEELPCNGGRAAYVS